MLCYGWPLASERPFAVVRGAPSTEVAPLSPYTWPSSRPYQTHMRPIEMMLHAASRGIPTDTPRVDVYAGMCPRSAYLRQRRERVPVG